MSSFLGSTKNIYSYFFVISLSLGFSELAFSSSENSSSENPEYSFISTEEVTLESLSKTSFEEAYEFFVSQLASISQAWNLQEEFITSKAGKTCFKNFYEKNKNKQEELKALWSYAEKIIPEIFERFAKANWKITDKPTLVVSVCHESTGENDSVKNSLLLSLEKMESLEFLKQVCVHELVHHFHGFCLEKSGLPKGKHLVPSLLYDSLWQEGIAVAGVAFLFPELAALRHPDPRHLPLFEGGYFSNWANQFVKDSDRYKLIRKMRFGAHISEDQEALADRKEMAKIKKRWLGGLKTDDRPLGLIYLLGEGLIWYKLNMQKLSWEKIFSLYGEDHEQDMRKSLRLLKDAPFYLLTENYREKAKALHDYECKNRERVAGLIISERYDDGIVITDEIPLASPNNESEILSHLGKTLSDTINSDESSFSETKELLEQGTPIHMTFEWGYSALMIAAAKNPELVQLLLDFGADASYDVANLVRNLEAREHLHETAISVAIREQNDQKARLQTVKLLLKYGCPVHDCDVKNALTLQDDELCELLSSSNDLSPKVLKRLLQRNFSSACKEELEQEKKALEVIASQIPNQDTRKEFLSGNPCYKKVNEEGFVTSLQLDSVFKKGGDFPREICLLKRLETLSLRKNGLKGSLPPCLGDLAHLNEIDLGDNDLTGTIPEEWQNLSRSLKNLILDWNHLSGSIPEWFSTFTSLEGLYIGPNTFTGTLPLSLSKIAEINGWDEGNQFDNHDEFEAAIPQ